MHPAFSVIFFTTLSGAGYGLAFVLALGVATGYWPVQAPQVLVPLLIALVLATVGLGASFAHLGQPQRAWRAFSQWRSSWLSREGVASVLTYLPAVALLLLVLFSASSAHTPARRAAGALLAVGCFATVFCTARIYSSLKTIRAWHNAFVLPGYLLFAYYTGGLWLWALAAWSARDAEMLWLHIGLAPWLLATFVFAATALAILKLFYWRHIDDAPPVSTPESATGLGRYGSVASFERPHTEESYITKEMGFVLARTHSAKLRAFALLSGLGIPLAAMICAMFQPYGSPLFALVALAAGSIGVFVERWLFFAEAKHVVTLYYGSSRA